MVKVVTIRLPDDLNRQLALFAKKKELSKNQVVKMAIRNWLKEKKREENEMLAEESQIVKKNREETAWKRKR